MSKIPEIIFTESFIVADLIKCAITSLTNIRLKDLNKVFSNLDDRINNNKVSLIDCSPQIIEGYLMYLKYLPLIDSEQYNKYERSI